jgi:hypothetical protein
MKASKLVVLALASMAAFAANAAPSPATAAAC